MHFHTVAEEPNRGGTIIRSQDYAGIAPRDSERDRQPRGRLRAGPSARSAWLSPEIVKRS
jgi:hypothetical protein